MPDARPSEIGDHFVMAEWDRELVRLVEHGRDREAAALAVRHLSLEGGSMNPIEQLDELAVVLEGVVTQLTPAQLDEPTPCSEFTVQGVLEHMIGGGTMFAAAFRGEPAPAVDPDDTRDPFARFDEAMTALFGAVHTPGALDRTIAAPFGDVPGDAFARFVALDGLLHGWDIATATGQPYDPPAALVADVTAFAREAIVPAMREAKMFAPPTEAPAGATPIEELAAFTGRRV